MSGGEVFLVLLLGLVALFFIIMLFKMVRIVPQQQEYIVERLGKYSKTLTPGLNFLVPILDAVRSKVDKREQVVSFPPQPVITSDNLVVSIDTVIYYMVTDSVRATYAISNYLQGVEQLTVTTLRNVVGSMDLEQALTSRDTINSALRTVLDEATGQWGIKVTRVEIKAIDPPPSVRESMEKQMRAERDKRAAILTAEGVKASQVLTAQGEQEAAVLRAQGDRQARILQAEGQSKAIETVFTAIHKSNPDEKLLAYQYLQTLPQIAAGQSNKLWMIPAELTRALESFSGAVGGPISSGPASAVTNAVSQALSSEQDGTGEAAPSHTDADRSETAPRTPSAEDDDAATTRIGKPKPGTDDTQALEAGPKVSPSQFTATDAANTMLDSTQVVPPPVPPTKPGDLPPTAV
ncbi:SPFH domain-containing protein [Stackebrandtia nassauensis]|uniref:Band 7 protein n=1 Tax=Stackebrandtia nassauensis (strain DSM 44728 / CIP 108903 / NRRL B-16338 / NBRC 102104 / LLR-40K-21) TaxID=446470 RepID=D3Q503_STANL|nr:SPFH domain-containing protein [Stackebrandtia nassauensis]ADD42183.1 band 7 protein [Stackebrandtia nassauensis DSM 44728]